MSNEVTRLDSSCVTSSYLLCCYGLIDGDLAHALLCCCGLIDGEFYTLSGGIGKVVASHAAVARSIPVEVALIYNMHEALRGYCP